MYLVEGLSLLWKSWDNIKYCPITITILTVFILKIDKAYERFLEVACQPNTSMEFKVGLSMACWELN